MQMQLAKETRQLPVGLGCWCLEHSLQRDHDFRICSDSNSDITSVLEIAKSGANLVSDRKVNNVAFPRNLGCALADFYGHYSPRTFNLLCHLCA